MSIVPPKSVTCVESRVQPVDSCRGAYCFFQKRLNDANEDVGDTPSTQACGHDPPQLQYHSLCFLFERQHVLDCFCNFGDYCNALTNASFIATYYIRGQPSPNELPYGYRVPPNVISTTTTDSSSTNISTLPSGIPIQFPSIHSFSRLTTATLNEFTSADSTQRMLSARSTTLLLSSSTQASTSTGSSTKTFVTCADDSTGTACRGGACAFRIYHNASDDLIYNTHGHRKCISGVTAYRCYGKNTRKGRTTECYCDVNDCNRWTDAKRLEDLKRSYAGLDGFYRNSARNEHAHLRYKPERTSTMPAPGFWEKTIGLGAPLFVFVGLISAILLLGVVFTAWKIRDRRKNKEIPPSKKVEPTSRTEFPQSEPAIVPLVATSAEPIIEEKDEGLVLKALEELSHTSYEDWHARWTKAASKLEPSADLCPFGLQKENKKKCRFKTNRMCIESTRVYYANDARRFVDANWVDADRSLICASAPLGRGVPGREDTRAEFYHMLVSLDVAAIVMTCQIDELAPRSDKHFVDLIYFPHRLLTQSYKLKDGRFFHVTWFQKSKKSQVGLEKSQISVVFYDEEGNEIKKHTISHYYITSWLEHSLCTDTNSICDVLGELVDLKSPTLVHCSDGQGRTGSFALMLLLLRAAVNDQKVDPIGLSVNLRNNRYRAILSPMQFTFAIYCTMATLIRYVNRVPPEIYAYMSEFNIALMKHYADDARASERRRIHGEQNAADDAKAPATSGSNEKEQHCDAEQTQTSTTKTKTEVDSNSTQKTSTIRTTLDADTERV